MNRHKELRLWKLLKKPIQPRFNKIIPARTEFWSYSTRLLIYNYIYFLTVLQTLRIPLKWMITLLQWLLEGQCTGNVTLGEHFSYLKSSFLSYLARIQYWPIFQRTLVLFCLARRKESRVSATLWVRAHIDQFK